MHYTGKLEDGSTFDSSVGREPLTLTLGVGSVVPGFEAAILGLEVGQRRTHSFPAEQGYGTL